MSRIKVERSLLHHDGSLRAAIALNNSASTLLEQGNNRASMTIFKESVQLMKFSLVSAREQGNGRGICESLLHQKTEACLKLAIQETAHKNESDILGVASVPSDMTNFRVTKISSQDDPFSVLAAIEGGKARKGSALADLYCITIDSKGIDDVLAENADVKSAFILYNYGVTQCSTASFYLSNASSSGEERLSESANVASRLYKGSLSLLQVCERNILPILIQSSVGYQSTSILILSLLIFQATTEVAHQLSNFGLEDEYQRRFTCVATIIRSIQSIMPPVHFASAAQA